MQQLLRTLPDANLGFVMKCLCLPDPVSRRSTTIDHVRLFRRHFTNELVTSLGG